jgi:NADH dehydrogenase
MSVVGAASDSPMELFRMKHAAEEHLRASGTAWTIVRATAFLESWIDLLAQTADRTGRSVVFGGGTNPINFVSVRDVADVVDRAIAETNARGETIEIGGPDNLTLIQIAQAAQPAGPTAAPRHVPTAALRAMSMFLRPFWPERARQAAAAVALDTMDMRFDPSAIFARYPDLSLTSFADVVAWRAASRQKMTA